MDYVYISVLKATSTINQAKLIENVIRERGYNVKYQTFIPLRELLNPKCKGAIYFWLGSPLHFWDHIVNCSTLPNKAVLYLTIEGIPIMPKHLLNTCNRARIIAVSEFSRKCLKEAGIKCIDVIHHAVDPELCIKAMHLAVNIKRQLQNKYGDKTIILYVGRNDPRKALPKLKRACEILATKRNDYVVLLKTDGSAKNMFKDVPNVEFFDVFGNKSYVETLALIGACDYLVFPSVCEGFGLPVLEANAMARPVIHAWIPPLSEFSSKDYNFVFDYVEIRMIKNANVQYWIFHEYPPEWLSEMMDYAIDVHRNHKDEYLDYCQKARHVWDTFNYKKLYGKLVSYINL